MENFYVVFDASDPTNNRVGLSFNVKKKLEENSEGAALVLSLICVLIFAALMTVTIVCICIRKRRMDRLADAKRYFGSL